MTLIPNFPQDLVDQHRAWHHGTTRGAKPGAPGGGLEFLLFHRRFLAQVYDRFRAEGRPLHAPAWSVVPDAVKNAAAYLEKKDHDGTVIERTGPYKWLETPGIDAAVVRLQTTLETFGSADHLGNFIEHAESGFLHGWLHAFAAAAYNEPVMGDVHDAPRTVEFYSLHNLIDRWFSDWVKKIAPGHLWHTVRTAPWPPLYYGDVTAANGVYMPEVRRVAVAADGPNLHVLIARTDGELWHAIRYQDSWQKFHNVGDVLGRPGRVEDVACAVVNGELHVCTVTDQGRIMHTIRYPDRWQPWGDASSAARAPGTFGKVSCAAVAGSLHVVALSGRDGRPWHTVRYPDRWQPFGNVAGAAGDRGWIDEVDCAGDGDGLHVVAVNADGKLWHTTRQPTSWTPFADVCTTSAGRLDAVRRVACSVVNGELHVCAVDDPRRTVRHTIRYPNSWQPWGNMTAVTESIDVPAYADLACGSVNGLLHVCLVGAEHRP